MAIYRPPKARWPLAVASAFVSLAVGIGIGYALRGGTDALEGAQEIRSGLAAAAAGLEVAAIEYDEAVEDGEVLREAEYDGALDALDRSRSTFESVAPALELVAPPVVAQARNAYGEALAAMLDKEDIAEVERSLHDLRALLVGKI